MTPTPLSAEDFEKRFKPVQNHIDTNAPWGGMMFETYGPELDFVAAQPDNLVWTLLDTGDELILASGRHLVNRMGFLIATVPVPPGEHFEVED